MSPIFTKPDSSSVALVTGATGAIGPALVQHLLADGYRVRVLARRLPCPNILPASVRIFQGDIGDRGVLHAAVSGTEVVFHLAAKVHISVPAPELRTEYERVNIEGTRFLVEAAQAADVHRLVFFSTISVYGPSRPGEVMDENAPLNPECIYAHTKCQAEKVVLGATQRRSNKPLAVVLRLGAVYGPRIKGNYARLVSAIRRGWFIPIGPGQNRRTLVYDQDVVAAALLAAKHPLAGGQVYNVTDGQIHTFNDILMAICQALGKRAPRYHLPVWFARPAARLVYDGLRLVGKSSPLSHVAVDKLIEDVAVKGEKIQRDLGFQPKFDLITGWRETIYNMAGRE